jgi:hypothetical protein
MNLFTDDNPETTIKGLKYSNKIAAKKSIEIVEKHFNSLLKQQKIPGNSPANLRPKKTLNTREEATRYFEIQKMYRILGLRNRAKVHSKHPDIHEAFMVFDAWMKNYKNKN